MTNDVFAKDTVLSDIENALLNAAWNTRTVTFADFFNTTVAASGSNPMFATEKEYVDALENFQVDSWADVYEFEPSDYFNDIFGALAILNDNYDDCEFVDWSDPEDIGDSLYSMFALKLYHSLLKDLSIDLGEYLHDHHLTDTQIKQAVSKFR